MHNKDLYTQHVDTEYTSLRCMVQQVLVVHKWHSIYTDKKKGRYTMLYTDQSNKVRAASITESMRQ